MRTLLLTLPALLLSACTPPDSSTDKSDGGGDTNAVDNDGDGHSGDADCDDEDAAVYVGAPELCDEVDNDCDDDVDENPSDPTTFYADVDGDGFGDQTAHTDACVSPAGYVAEGGDCNDVDPNVHPGATEDNCDDPTDYNCDGSTGYADADTDGFPACQDCADNNGDVNPDALEYCNDIDDNCDSTIDEGSAVDATVYFADTDDDGYGDPAVTETFCEQEPLWSDNPDDCDDTDSAEYPGADEHCDGDDDNCNGVVDEATAVDAPSWYADSDMDGYGNPLNFQRACDQPGGYLADGSDCDDTNGSEHPGATEYCDGDDDNCDGVADEDTAADATTWWADADSDGYGNAASTKTACYLPAGYAGNSTDCDDSNDDEHPGADEYCDGDDDNCDGVTDESTAVDADTWYRDSDSDTYGNPSTANRNCNRPSGYVADGTDCNDASSGIHPGATETTGDSVDQNCDSSETCYADADNDTYRASGGTTVASTDTDCADSGEGTTSDPTGDCNDASSSVNPGVEEVCNDVDDDCDGHIDWGHRVPDDHTSISAAITAASNYDTICVDPGTYVDRIDFGGKLITILGVSGSGSTTISGGGSGPVVTFDGGEDYEAVLDGFTITSGSSTTGSGVYLSGSSPTLQNLVITGNTCATSSSSCYGTGVYSSGGSPSFDNVEITDNTQYVSGTSYAYNYGAGAYLSGGTPTFTDCLIDGNYQYAAAPYPQNNGGGVYAQYSSPSFTSTDITNNDQVAAATITTAEPYANGTNSGTGLFLYSYGTTAAQLDDVRIEDNYANVSSGYQGTNQGTGLYGYYYGNADISNSTIDGNYAYGSATYMYAYGVGAYLYYYNTSAITNTEITENYSTSTYSYGGGFYAGYYANPVLTNVIIAGNILGNSSSAYSVGAGMETYYYSVPVITNASIVGNTMRGNTCYGGGIQLDYYGGVDILNVDLSANSLSCTYSYGSAISEYSTSYASTIDIDYCNFYGNSSPEFYTMTTPVSSSGNVSKNPRYTDTSSSDSALWDLRLTAVSNLKNIGDTSILDTDGTRSDIGAWGGPGAAYW